MGVAPDTAPALAERGKKNFSLTTLEKIAKALDVTLAEVFSGKSAPYAPKTRPDKRLLSLFREATPEDQAFLIKHAKFLIRRKK